MAKIHNGFINDKLKNTFKDSGLNNFDLATTKVYKGVKPMWEQLGFQNDDSDNPNDNSYWKKIIPSNFTFLNLSNVTVRNVEADSTIGVSKGSRITRQSYSDLVINQETDQNWNDNYSYPILPRINKFGIFEHEINTSGSYGNENALITNLQDSDSNLIFDLDLGTSTTDDIIDKTEISKITYNQDIELALDKDLRLEVKTLNTSDSIEIDNTEQAF
jgi:hypothetical protein